jgi:crotonobetainyl-CoA:carnitine CoA-transferase CaiB-like acyl-CoA transferase
MQPLAGVRVVDLTTGIAGGYATKLLADAGAEVWKIEPPGGDPLRAWSASGRSLDEAGDGALFRYLHTSKRSAVLDLERPAGREALLSLYAGADLVLESSTPGRLDAQGVGAAAFSERSPGGSWLSLTPFGRGPWSERPASELTLQAWCGSVMSRGRPGQPPLYAAGELGEWMSGTYLAVGALAALRRSDLCGQGDRVDVSKLEAITPTFTNAGSVWGQMSGLWDVPMSEDVPSIEPTADGWIGFCLFTPQQWSDFALLIERPDLAGDASLHHMVSRFARAEEIRAIVRAYTRARTTAELLERSELLRVPAAPIGNGASLPGMDHFRERGVFVRNPRGGFLQPRIPYESTAWPRRVFEPAPRLDGGGQAGARPAWTSSGRAHEKGALAADAPPLAGLRVLDLTAFWAGPYAGFVLACLGADVIHVESIQRPDGMRFGTQAPPGTERWWEQGPTCHSANTGKRSLTLDLTRPEGQELLVRLARESDVLLENYSPRVLDSFGLGWERLEALCPRLVLVRMPAFGLGGPWRNRVGFAQTMEQVSGIAWLTAYPESAGEQAGPLTPRACADPLAGLHAAFAALVALRHRLQGDRGCQVESVMVETALAVSAESVIEHDVSGELLCGEGNRSPRMAPQGLYRCAPGSAGEPRWVALSASDDARWAALADCIGRAEWACEARFGSRAGRRAAHDEIDAAIEAWTRERTPEEALRALLARGVAAACVVGSRRGEELEPLRGSDFFEPVQHPVAGSIRIPALPLRFGRRPKRWFERPAPTLGEHNEEILVGLLGLSRAELLLLSAAGVIGTKPRGL